jgi:integrase
MAVYKPKRKDIESKFFVCEFVYQGKRIQESTGATTKTIAREYEKRRKGELERAAAGLPTEQKSKRIRTVSDVIEPYLAGYRLSHRPKSIVFAEGCLAHVEQVLGGVILSDLTEERIKSYVRRRMSDCASGRTINAELGELSRAIGQPWSLLWPKVRKLEERKDVGRALSGEEQNRLLAGLKDRMVTPHLPTLLPLLLLTGMRIGEALSLTWARVDLMGGSLQVGRAKTPSGTGRVLPINKDLASILATHRAWFVERFGDPRPAQYLFPWGSPPSDPTRPTTNISTAWNTLRGDTGVSCRIHDLRHTFATHLAEEGVPESTMLALMGHMSRSMLERYSHIRMTAKRDAVAGITLRRKVDFSGVPVKVPVLESIAGPMGGRTRKSN